MGRDIVFDSCLVQEEERYLLGLHLVTDLHVSVSRVAARHGDSRPAFRLVSALLLSVWLHGYASRLRWKQRAMHTLRLEKKQPPEAKENWKSSAGKQKPIFCLQSIFCATFSSRSVSSWKWQVDVCFAISLKVGFLGHLTLFLTAFLILLSLLCAKQNKLLCIAGVCVTQSSFPDAVSSTRASGWACTERPRLEIGVNPPKFGTGHPTAGWRPETC